MPTENATALRSIVRDLKRNLLVEAGAGTGKTYALVSRVAALIKSGVRMENIVAITFTEAAAAELSDRIRGRMEQLRDEKYRDESEDPLVWDGEKRLRWTRKQVGHLRRAVAELDRASIQTIHSFAARILRERPLDVGLPPGWAQWDELAASQDFAKRWDAWLAEALGQHKGNSPHLEASFRYLIASRIGLLHWRTLADEFRRNNHRLSDDDCLPTTDLSAAAQIALKGLKALADNRPAKASDSDRLLVQLLAAIETVEEVVKSSQDPLAAARALQTGAKVDFSDSVGSKNNWCADPADVRKEFRSIGHGLRVAVLHPLLHNLRQHFAIDYERERKADGVATFDDLLVWARDLLLDENSWEDLRQRYQYILLDEFQDTDPLQAEIAFYLAAEKAPVKTDDWHRLKLKPGRLFIVGDPKQSIYRFRGADIEVTNQVKGGGQLQELRLVDNRRSQEPILHWVNEVFGELMAPKPGAIPGVQAGYVPLQGHPGAQRAGLNSGVGVFGGGSRDKAADVRQREATDLANLILAYAAPGANRLKVREECNCDSKGCGCARPANLRDVCILIRSRTGLGILERSLEDRHIPYRIEGGSLLFNTQEIQDLLNCLRAIDNPSDEVSVVAALRSPAFACSDVDLALWRHDHGRWNYLRKTDADSLVADSLKILRDYHDRRHSIPISRLISDFIRERRLDELDLSEYRPREAWRRRQFLVEQARVLEAANPSGDGQSTFNLNRFIRWAELQMEEGNRITEVPVPETDDDAVRIMTMHGAKGLEFPIIFLLDLDYEPRANQSPVLFNPESGVAEISVGSASAGTQIRTPGFGDLADRERVHRAAEEARLAYVAATRAMDHLIVSCHCRVGDDGEPLTEALQLVMGGSMDGYQTALTAEEINTVRQSTSPDHQAPEPPAYDYASWQQRRNESAALRSIRQTVTATQIAGHGGVQPDQEIAVAIDDKEAEADQERTWRTGRGGTEFGSALHGVLQDAISRLLLEGPDRRGERKELLQWLDAAIGRLAPRNADDNGVGDRVAGIMELAQKAIRNEWVLDALQADRLWPEIPVAAEIKTPRGKVAIEGIIDLLYLDGRDDRLVILDYKSDQVSSDREIREKMEFYQWQGAAYAYAVEKATRKTVKDVRFLFVRREQAESIPNLRKLMDQLPERTSRIE